MSKRIKLTQGKYALVDDEDYDYLNQWKWRTLKGRNTFYAVRSDYSSGNKTILMHREIIEIEKGYVTDHINHNGLDNRKMNLRQCTNRQNCQNAILQDNNTSGYKGVCFHGQANKYVARIRVNGKRKSLGLFLTAKEAGAAYNKAALKYYGEYSNINDTPVERAAILSAFDDIPKVGGQDRQE